MQSRTTKISGYHRVSGGKVYRISECGFDDDDWVTCKRKELPESDADAGLKKECAKCGSMEHALSTMYHL